MLTKTELSDAKRICNTKEPTMKQVRYFTYVLYPKWLQGRSEKYEYDDDKVLIHFKIAKQDFLSMQLKELR